MRTGSRKYHPLAAYLAGLPPETETVTLSFPEIEALIGEPLPPTARARPWWSNIRGMTPRPWFVAGWQVARCELHTPAPAVTFERRPPR